MKIYDIMLFVNEYRKRCLRYFCLFLRTIAPLAEPRQSGLRNATNVVEWKHLVQKDISSVSYLGKGECVSLVLIKLDTTFTDV